QECDHQPKGPRTARCDHAGEWRGPKEVSATGLRLDPQDSNRRPSSRWTLTGVKVKSANWDCAWSVDDDSRLLAGVYEYGIGSWEAIKMDPSYRLTDKV